MATRTLLTLEQFDQLPQQGDALRELDEGELVVVARGTPRHNMVRDNMARHLMNFAHERRLGRVFLETEFELSPDTVRIPDVAFVPGDRMKQLDLDRRIEGAPGIAIEVVSPTDLAEELTRRIDQYLAAGTQAVWVLYPRTREVHIFKPGEIKVVRGDQDVLEHQELLPDFSIRLAEVFE